MQLRKPAVIALLCTLALAGCASSSDPTRGSAEPAAPSAAQSADRASGTPDRPSSDSSARETGGFVAVAVGDIVCPPGVAKTPTTCGQAETAALTASLDPDAVLALGDLQYNAGRLRHFRVSYDKSWGALKSITYPVPGNHEYYTSGASGYYAYFDKRQPGTPGYYKVMLGDWTAYALNSNCDEINCTREAAWLKRQLGSDTSCSLFFDHHPRYSSGEHGNDRDMGQFFKIAYDHDVELFLSGHDHDYERYAPMNPDGEIRRRQGVVQYVSGAGGKSHYRADGDVTGSLSVIDDVFGVLRLVLRADGYQASFRDIDARTSDAVRRGCH